MTDGRLGWRTYLTAGVVAAMVMVAMGVVSHHSHDVPTLDVRPAPTRTAPPGPVKLTFGVWGTPAEVKAYRTLVASYDERATEATVELKVYPSAGALATAVASPETTPNIYLLRRTDLGEVVAQDRNRPLQDLLADRGVSLGDDYSRDAVTAFSSDDNLQCMPFTVSPMVIYYNADLIHFDRMKARGLDVPADKRTSFTLNEFRTAARVGSNARGSVAGVAIDPTLEALAPFVYSGGGHLFDDETAPTRLALGDGGAPGAMRTTLEILRDPRLTLSTAQLKRRTALEWFEAGKLGIIAGFRDLVPQLRAVHGLQFDVLPMPSIGSSKTVGDFTGACLSSGQPKELPEAADFLTYLVGDSAMRVVARTGSLQPANLSVAYSNAFVQPTQRPAHGTVFTAMLRYIQPAPLGVPWTSLEAAVGPKLAQLLTVPVLDDLDDRLDQIDQLSQSILSPTTSTTTSPSPTATATASH